MSGDALASWKIEFFAEDDETVPVRDWLDGLPSGVRGKVLARIALLKEHGPTLDYPYTSQIEGKLREARLRVGKTRYRVLYFFDDERCGMLLHGFTKDTAAVEEVDKKIGRARMLRHLERLTIKKKRLTGGSDGAREKR